MCICQRYNTTFTCYKEHGGRQGSELAFLLLLPTGFRILPFKVRPLSVSLYPHVSLILLSPGGAHQVPLRLLFFFFLKFVMQSHLQQVHFLWTLKKKQQLGAIYLTLCLEELFTLSGLQKR